MSKVAILTDSNSGITQKEANATGVYVLPMPFFIDGETFYEGINLSSEDFFSKMQSGADISTSQPSAGDIADKWKKLLEEYDEVVFIPMSSGLSGTCQTATILAEEFNGKVFVVDNQRISVTMHQSVLDAKYLADNGYTGEKIKNILEREKKESSIYIAVDTLKYLKKGGRVTAAGAAIGAILNIKPVLQIQGEKLDAYAKVRGKLQAKKVMLEAIRKDLDTRFKDSAEKKRIHLEVSYVGDGPEVQEWAELVQKTFPDFDFNMDPLSLVIACHIGPSALAVAISKYIDEEK